MSDKPEKKRNIKKKKRQTDRKRDETEKRFETAERPDLHHNGRFVLVALMSGSSPSASNSTKTHTIRKVASALDCFPTTPYTENDTSHIVFLFPPVSRLLS